MRLWHKNLIPLLPRKQLISQWRECCCIARNIAVNGTPNHLLVNTVLDYPLSHLWSYSNRIYVEMTYRGFSADLSKLAKYFPEQDQKLLSMSRIWPSWHTNRYLLQCYYNLQEKYDRGGVPEEEWLPIQDYVENRKNLV